MELHSPLSLPSVAAEGKLDATGNYLENPHLWVVCKLQIAAQEAH